MLDSLSLFFSMFLSSPDDSNQTRNTLSEQNQSVIERRVDSGNSPHSLNLFTLTDDNVLSSEESRGAVTVKGELRSPFVNESTFVRFISGDFEYTATFSAQGLFQADIPGSILKKTTTLQAEANLRDTQGNTITLTDSHDYILGVEAQASISVDSITADNVINTSESRQTVDISGQVKGDFIYGDTVSINLGNLTFRGTVVTEGRYTVQIPGAELAKQNKLTANITVTNDAGNSYTASLMHTYEVDTDIAASLFLNEPDGNAILSASDAGKDIDLTGQIKGDFRAGDPIKIEIAGSEFETALTEDGSFKAAIPGSLLLDNNYLLARAEVSDSSGNTLKVRSELDYVILSDESTLDAATPPKETFDSGFEVTKTDTPPVADEATQEEKFGDEDLSDEALLAMFADEPDASAKAAYLEESAQIPEAQPLPIGEVQVIGLEGEVSILRDGVREDVRPGLRLIVGDTLMTKSDSAFKIRLANGVDFIAGQNTRARFDADKRTLTGEGKYYRFYVFEGDFEAASDSESNKVRIWTPNASIKLHQGRVLGNISQEEESFFITDGTALVESEGVELGLSNGEQTMVAEAKPPNVPLLYLEEETVKLTESMKVQEVDLEDNVTIGQLEAENARIAKSLTDKGKPDMQIISTLDSLPQKQDKIRAVNNAATVFLRNNQPQEALNLLQYYEKKGEQNNDTLFLLGVASRTIEDYERSEKYFIRLLERGDAAHRVRLELATVQYKLGKYKEAKQNFYIVKASSPPKKVGENIDEFLDSIAAQSPNRLEFEVSAGYLYDDNVNAGPSTDSVLVFNIPFTLDDDAKANADKANLYNLAMRHLGTLNDYFSLQTTASVTITDYHQANTLDSMSFSASTGPSFKEGRFAYSVPIVYNRVQLGHEDDFYVQSYGLAPQVTFQYTDRLSFGSSLSYQQNHYFEGFASDSHTANVALSMKYLTTPSSYVTLGGNYAVENAAIDFYTNEQIKVSAGYFQALTKNLNFFFSPNISWVDYKDNEEAFSEDRRRDTISNLNTSLSYFLENYSLNTSIVHIYTDNKSNYAIYDYERDQFLFIVSGKF